MSDSTTRLTRNTLYVPASRPDMIEKAAKSATDAVCIDLEDSIPSNKKEESRKNVIDALLNIEFGHRLRMFRINGIDTHFAYSDIIDVVETAGQNIDLIMIPKAQKAHDIQFVDTLLTQIEAHKGIPHRIGIEAQIETASGFLGIRKIAQSSSRLESLIFGSGDYAASMRMPMDNIGMFDANDELYPGHRFHAPMHAIVAAARTNGLRCMDTPYADFKDDEGFEQACRIALAMGFDGKQCIHPSQLEITNHVFAPSPEELTWAREVEAAYEQSSKEGVGVISLNGKMIDAANLRMAQTTLQKQQAIDEQETGK